MPPEPQSRNPLGGIGPIHHGQERPGSCPTQCTIHATLGRLIGVPGLYVRDVGGVTKVNTMLAEKAGTYAVALFRPGLEKPLFCPSVTLFVNQRAEEGPA